MTKHLALNAVFAFPAGLIRLFVFLFCLFLTGTAKYNDSPTTSG